MSKIAAIVFAVSVLSVDCVFSTADSDVFRNSGIRAGQRSVVPGAAMRYTVAAYSVQGTIGGMTGGTSTESPQTSDSDSPLFPKGGARISGPLHEPAVPDGTVHERTTDTPVQGATGGTSSESPQTTGFDSPLSREGDARVNGPGDGSAVPDAAVQESTAGTPDQGTTGGEAGRTGLPEKGSPRKGSPEPASDCDAPARILFDIGRDNIRDEQFGTIDRVGVLMHKYPSAAAIIEGHADDSSFSSKQGGNIARHFADMELSQRRAERVAQHLAKKYGIARSRVAAKWYGNTRPETEAGTLSERAVNRRVVLILDCEPPPK